MNTIKLHLTELCCEENIIVFITPQSNKVKSGNGRGFIHLCDGFHLHWTCAKCGVSNHRIITANELLNFIGA